MFNFMLNVFQSTLPREERPSIPPATPTIIDFNPRSHERSDSFTTALSMYLTISIHAPTRGATTSTVPSAVSGVFQSTLPREERLSSLACMLIFPIFQSTLPREERPSTSWIRQSTTRFQSTLPREERRNGTFTIGALIAISIHAPTRGATRTISQVSVFIVFQSTLPREERRLHPLSV